MFLNDFSLLGLFVSSFISATLLPGGSELLLFSLLQQPTPPVALLIAVATIGNSLGGWLTWWFGRALAVKYPLDLLSNPRHQWACQRLRRFGLPALLFAWLPIIGDALCFSAGWLRTDWVMSCVYIGIGKLARYLVIVSIFLA